MVSGLDHGRRSGFPILHGGRGGWLEDDSDVEQGSAGRRIAVRLLCSSREGALWFLIGGSAMPRGCCVQAGRERYGGYRLQCGPGVSFLGAMISMI